MTTCQFDFECDTGDVRTGGGCTQILSAIVFTEKATVLAHFLIHVSVGFWSANRKRTKFDSMCDTCIRFLVLEKVDHVEGYNIR